MSSLSELLSFQPFVDFYKSNENSTTNLFKQLNDSSITGEYLEGLTRLEVYLDNNFDSDEIKKVLGRQYDENKSDINKIKEICILLYKILNRHVISTDLSRSEMREIGLYKHSYDMIKNKCIFSNFTDNFKVLGVNAFADYCLNLKLFRICLGDVFSNVDEEASTNEFNTTRDTYITSGVNSSHPNISGYDPKDQQTEQYKDTNAYFTKFGRYYPVSKKIDVTFFNDNIDMFNMVPSSAPLIVKALFQNAEGPSKAEVSIESEILSHIEIANNLLSPPGVNFEFDRQIGRQLTFANKDLTSMMPYTKAKPDITLKFGGGSVPIEIKKGGIRKSFVQFLNCRQVISKRAKPFIKSFSQGFHQALVLSAPFFFLSDADFCIAVKLRNSPAGDPDNVSDLRSVKCDISTFESNMDKMNVAAFIIMFSLRHRDLFKPHSTLKRCLETYVTSPNEREKRMLNQYAVLDQFNDQLVTLQPLNNLTKQDILTTETANSTLSNDGTEYSELEPIYLEMEIEELEREITVNQIEVKLQKFANIRSNFNTIDMADLNVKKIISGKDVHRNYSTVIETKEGEIYKFLDPVRTRIASKDVILFADKVEKIFDLFVREVSTYLLLEKEAYPHIPQLLGYGYVKNVISEWCNSLECQNFQTKGFYIKLSKIQGKVLHDVKWTHTIESKLRDVISDLLKLNISHGDLHSKNVMYDPQTETMKIFDFGISEVADDRFLNNLGNQPRESGFNGRKQCDLANLEELIRYCSKRN